MLRKILNIFLFVLLIASAGLFYANSKNPEVGAWIRSEIQHFLGTAPCQKPISYSLGNFDKRFGITEEEFLMAAESGAEIWNKVLQKKLFEYLPGKNEKNLKINLIYDYRQQATDQLKTLGFKIDDTKTSYESLKKEFYRQKAEYEIQSEALRSKAAALEAEKKKFNSDVAYWNGRGGAPKNVYDSLSREQDRLKAGADNLQTAEAKLNKKIAMINTIIDALNKTARDINVNVETFNKIGQSTGEEFSEGLYISDITGASISVYQFNDKNQLIRLLTHELGHALGLEHISNPKAIMYKLNESKNLTPTADDIAELKRICDNA